LENDPCFNGAPLTGALRAACIATGVPAAIANAGATARNTDYTETNFGNPKLTPESADAYTLGFVLQNFSSAPNLSFTADYFSITLGKAIDTVGIHNILQQCYQAGTGGTDPLCALVIRDPTTGLVTRIKNDFLNSGKQRVRGIDFGVRWSRPLRLWRDGSLEVVSNASYLIEQLFVPFAAIPSVRYDCVGLYGLICPAPSPRWKANTRVGWDSGPFSVDLMWVLIGPMSDENTKFDPTTVAQLAVRRVPARNYLHLTTSWQIRSWVELHAGIENLFDTKPPIVGQDRSDVAIELATFPAQYDLIGRRFYLGTTVKF
jgi:outer membrane receptor protein involved in Fe transport